MPVDNQNAGIQIQQFIDPILFYKSFNKFDICILKCRNIGFCSVVIASCAVNCVGYYQFD